MRLTQWALAAAVFAAVTPSLAWAQWRPQTMRSTSPVSRTAYEYRDYYAEEGEGQAAPPAPEAAAPEAEQPAPAASSCDNGCGNGCGEENGCDNGCGEEDEAWKLFDCQWLKCRNINIAGWVAVTPFTWNPQNPENRFNGPVTWTDRSNEPQLNQLYLYAERSTNTDGYGQAIGGRLDLLYGTDNRFTRATNWDTDINRAQRFYGLAIPQLYGEVATGDWKTKLGHFYSPVGYEVVPTTGNFFNSLPYTFQYGEPFTHMGFLSTYGGSERFTFGSGLIRGWDNVGQFNPSAGYLGTLTLNGEGGDSLALVVVESRELNQNLGFSFRHLQTLVYSMPLNDQWTYVAQSDLGIQSNALVSGQSAYWYGYNNYLFYKASDTWTWGVRAEWFRDQNGFRVGGFLPLTSGGSLEGLPTAFSGYQGNFTQLTFGANWKPNSNWVVRPNIRWDTFNGNVLNADGLRPFDDGTKNWQILVGGDIILLY